MLPPDGMRMPIEFGLSWSPKTGVVFHGGATLEVELPIDLDLTIIKIPSIFLSLGAGIKPDEPPKVDARRGARRSSSTSDRCSPRRADGQWSFTSPSPRRAATSARSISRLGFKPPKGVALSVEAGPVSGGGYILLDYDKGEYAGILHLEIAGKFSDHGDRAAATRKCPTGRRASRSSS